LDQSSVLVALCSYQLASSLFPLGVIFQFFATLLLLACFLFVFTWSILPVFRHFAPTSLLPLCFLLEQSSGFLPLCSYSLASQTKKHKKTRRHKPTRFAGEKNWLMKPMYITQQI